MASNRDIIKLVYEAIDGLNSMLPSEQKLEKSLDTHLWGGLGTLDSHGLVVFIIGVEEKMEEGLGLTISLTDQRALSQEDSPYATVESLVNYLDLLMKEQFSQTG